MAPKSHGRHGQNSQTRPSPSVSSYQAQKVYWKNYKSLDRDKDGTACER